jgi:hypothetical protein
VNRDHTTSIGSSRGGQQTVDVALKKSGLHIGLGFHGLPPFLLKLVVRLNPTQRFAEPFADVNRCRYQRSCLRCPGSELIVRFNGISTGLHVRPDFHGCTPFVDFCCLFRASFVFLLRSAVVAPGVGPGILSILIDALALSYSCPSTGSVPAFTFVLIFMAALLS